MWQYVIACIHPSQYKELIKKKKGAFVGYVAVLVMFLVLIENVIPFAAWTASVGGLENLVLNRIPKFTLEKGYFQSESPIDFTIGGVVHIKADSSVEEFKESDFKSDYVQELLVGKKNILIKMPGGNQQIVLSQFKNWKLNNKGISRDASSILYVSCILFGGTSYNEGSTVSFGSVGICPYMQGKCPNDRG